MTNYKFSITPDNNGLKSKADRQAVLERVRKQRVIAAKEYWKKARQFVDTEEMTA